MCGKLKFHNDAPMLKYCQKLLNRCCFSILAQDFASIEQTKPFNDISFFTEEYLRIKVGNHVDIAKDIMKNEKNYRRTKIVL